MAEWSEYSLHQTHNERANALYHIGGLRFHMGKGDKTQRNFPGLKRLIIAPFEISAWLRWKFRYFDHYWEKKPLEWILEWASTGQMNELSNLGDTQKRVFLDDRISTVSVKDKVNENSAPKKRKLRLL